MAVSLANLDEVVKEYLVYRGFVGTLKSLEIEIKSDKEKGQRVDKIIDTFLHYITHHDLVSLRDLWSHLSTRLFSRLHSSFSKSVTKFEFSLYKLYLVHALQKQNKDRIKEFFELLAPELLGFPEWKDWFLLPFLKNPEDSLPNLPMYCSRSWQDTLLLSLYNFISIAYACAPPPSLASNFLKNTLQIKKLREDNEKMRNLLLLDKEELRMKSPEPPKDLLEDFYLIGPPPRTPHISGSEIGIKHLKSFLRTLTTGVSLEKKNEGRHVPVRRLSKNSEHYISSIPISSPFVLSHQEIYKKHTTEISHIKFSDQASLIASGDKDGVIHVWKYTPTLSSIVSASFSYPVTALDWIHNSDRYVVCGLQNGSVHLKDTQNIDSFSEFKTVTNSETVLISSGDTLALVSQRNGIVSLFDIETRELVRSFKVDESFMTSAVLTPTLLISGFENGQIQLRDSRVESIVRDWKLSHSILTLQNVGEIFYVLSSEGRLSSFYPFDGPQSTSELSLKNYYNFNSLIYNQQFAVSNDEKYVLFSSKNSSGTIVERESGTRIFELEGSPSTCCNWSSFSKTGSCVITSNHFGDIKISSLLNQ